MAILNAVARMNTVQYFEDAFKANDITSEAMQKAIQEWYDLYFDANNPRDDGAQRVPYSIIDGLCKACFGEYEISMPDTTAKDTALADTIANLDAMQGRAFQQTLIGGEGFLKPIPEDGNFRFIFIDRTNYIVLDRDNVGNITSMGLSSRTAHGKYFYTLLEKRTATEDGVAIENVLYKSLSAETIGTITPLSELYDGLKDSLVLPVEGLGLIHVKTPMENCVDGSHDGVSVYAAAVAEIRNMYWHEDRTNKEYEMTTPRLIASSDVIDDCGEIGDILYSIDDDPGKVGINVYNPTPNQTQLEARSNQLARNIENIIGLRRGILSHVETEDRTATEVMASTARYAMVISDLQKMWEDTVHDTLRICDQLGQYYFGWDASPPSQALIDFGDGVLLDRNKMWSEYMQMVSSGLLKPEIALAWYFNQKGRDEETLAEVREQYMPGIAEAD